jgi:hypothetical protein
MRPVARTSATTTTGIEAPYVALAVKKKHARPWACFSLFVSAYCGASRAARSAGMGGGQRSDTGRVVG